MPWDVIIKIGHIVGTVLGVGGATFAEIFHYQVAKSGEFNPTVGRFLQTTYMVLRLGLVLLVLSGFGYLIMLRLDGHAQYILGPRVLSKLLITFVILINAILLQTKKISLVWGSAISFVSWYAALVIGSWRGLPLSFWGIVTLYIATIAVFGTVKLFFISRQTKNKT